jgi:hypothetical protein
MKTPNLWITLFFITLACWFSCQEDPSGNDKAVQEIQTEGKISSIIRSPISAEGNIDTVNVAKMTFENNMYDFGEVKEGDVVKHEFKFTNTGKVPLLINNVHSTCGCTVPEWPKEAIQPGQSNTIKVEFNTKGKPDFQEKPVTISANIYPPTTKVFLKGYVKPTNE